MPNRNEGKTWTWKKAPSCLCGTCSECKHRQWAKEYYQRRGKALRKARIAAQPKEPPKPFDRTHYPWDRTTSTDWSEGA